MVSAMGKNRGSGVLRHYELRTTTEKYTGKRYLRSIVERC
jgi:hypothetical protein